MKMPVRIMALPEVCKGCAGATHDLVAGFNCITGNMFNAGCDGQCTYKDADSLGGYGAHGNVGASPMEFHPEEPKAQEGSLRGECGHDAVNHPDHYTQGGIECIDAIKAALGEEGFAAYCRGNILKYVWRSPMKGGLEDLKKARWYLDRLIGEVGSNGA